MDNSINDRIKEVRKFKGLSQTDFAYKMGFSREVISNVEYNRNVAKESLIKAVCREFSVDYFWLRDGIGEMFEAPPETLLDEIVDEFNLDELDRSIVESYIKLDQEKRMIIKEYLKNIFKLKIDE